MTPLGRRSLKVLSQRRPDLQVLGRKVSAPKRDPYWGGSVVCANQMCSEDGVGEDLEADDVPEWPRTSSVSWGSYDSLDDLNRYESDSDTSTSRSGSSDYGYF